MPKKIFILNAPEDNGYLEALNKELAILEQNNAIQSWDRSKVVAGANWQTTIVKKLQDADIVLLLISSDFLAQKWCRAMKEKALELGRYLIPVILRPCSWKFDKGLNALSAQPKQNGKVVPISSWSNQDEAFQNVVSAIYKVVEGMSKTSDITKKSIVTPRKTNQLMSINTEQIRQLLQNDRLDKAIKQLLQLVQKVNDNQLNTTATLLSARNNSNNRAQINGTISNDNFNRERNKINFALQSVLSELDRDYLNASVQVDGKDNFGKDNQSKITGDGNIVIQDVQGSQINIDTQGKDNKINKSLPKQKILFLAANPTDKARIQTDKEYRIIKAELERGRHREQYEFLLPQLSLTIGELLRAMSDKPDIVHFSGHSTTKGLMIVKDDNTHQLLSTPALKRLFSRAKKHAKIVLFNSCYSAEQAKVISKFGMYVIGHNLPVGDNAAISFTKGFYIGLSEGKSFDDAYNDAMIVLMTENDKYADVVEVWKDGQKLDL